MAAALVDTNVLVYRFDPRFPEKQRIATALLRAGIAEDTIRVPQSRKKAKGKRKKVPNHTSFFL